MWILGRLRRWGIREEFYGEGIFYEKNYALRAEKGL